MKKSNSYLIIFLIFSFTAVKISSQTRTMSSLLWEIRKDGNTNVSYIFGTNHLISGALIDTSEKINEIMSNVKELVCEVSEPGYDTLKMIRSMILSRDEEYIFKDSNEKKMVKDFIEEKTNRSFSSFENLKPMVMLLTLEYFYYLKLNPDCSKKNYESTDKYFMNTAKKLGKDIIGLETADEQMSILFDSIPFSIQLKSLISFIKWEKLNSFLMQNIDSCYKEMDYDCVCQYDYFSKFGGQTKGILLDNRNLRWIDKLADLTENNPVMIAVGLGHLGGKNGLLNLFKEKGYSVTPVMLN